MSNWDFGYSREPADPRDPQYPPPPGGAGGPRRPGGPRGRGNAGWRGTEGYPDAEGWPGHDGAPYDPQAAPRPLTYERDDFDWRPAGPTEGPARPWQAGPRRAATRPTSPGRAVPERPGPRQTASWQATPRSATPQRPAPAQAVPPPTYQFGGGQYVGEEPWLDDSRGLRPDGPWWEPDSWPGWQRWLIPVGVAVLAAAIGAALALLTGMHSGPSAAAGVAKSTTTSASPAVPLLPICRSHRVNDLEGSVFRGRFAHAQRELTRAAGRCASRSGNQGAPVA